MERIKKYYYLTNIKNPTKPMQAVREQFHVENVYSASFLGGGSKKTEKAPHANRVVVYS
jgi:hypothetical protein